MYTCRSAYSSYAPVRLSKALACMVTSYGTYTYMYIYHGTLQWQIICTYSDICGYVCMYHVYMYVYIDMHVHVPVESVHVWVCTRARECVHAGACRAACAPPSPPTHSSTTDPQQFTPPCPARFLPPTSPIPPSTFHASVVPQRWCGVCNVEYWAICGSS